MAYACSCRLSWPLLAALACSFGTVFLARNSLGYLGPFIKADLPLSHEHLGLLASAFSLAWAVSGIAVGALSSQHSRRTLLIAMLVLVGLSSMAAGFAHSFLTLFLARLASGLGGGPVMPLAQAYVAELGSETHRGLRMGLVQGVGSGLTGSVLAPLVLVPIATTWNWRGGHLLIAGVVFLAAVLLANCLPRGIREALPEAPLEKRGGKSSRRSSADVPLTKLNFALCCLISGAMISWLVLALTFFPSYLLTVRRSPGEMSLLMSLFGLGSILGAILVPHLSDVFDRRSILTLFALVGCLGPLALLIPFDSLGLLAIALFVGSTAGGTVPLLMAVIPSESVAPERLPLAIGILQGVGEIAGGVIMPVMAGWASDRTSLVAAVVLALVAAILATCGSLALSTTRPASRSTTLTEG